jgi:hypothetical protein
VLLAQRAQRQHDGAAHEAEVARVDGDRDAAQHDAQQAIERRGRRALEPGLAVPLATHGVDDVVPFAPARDHGAHDLGRILQVGVHDDDGVALGAVDARRDGGLVAEVARERQDLVARLARGELLEHGQRLILRAVVDEDDLPAGADLGQLGQEITQAPIELGDDELLVEHRDHERKDGPLHRARTLPQVVRVYARRRHSLTTSAAAARSASRLTTPPTTNERGW